MTTTIATQLVFSRLPLPTDLIRVLTDFPEMDIDAQKTKARLMEWIRNTPWSNAQFAEDEPTSVLVFYLEEDSGCRQFQMEFCMDCGNYVAPDYLARNAPPESHFNIRYGEIRYNIICRCNDAMHDDDEDAR